MSLRVTVLLTVAALLIASFAALGTLTTRLATTERIVVNDRPRAANAPQPTLSPLVAVQRRVRTGPPGFGQRFLAILGGIALVTMLAAMLLVNRILAPIETLTAAVRRMESGAFDTRVPVRRRDELGVLARSFNELAGRLQKAEESRRALVADIAHELRTPLTNVRGAIESLQDGVVAPSAEELDAIHGDVLLLERLIGDLHELSLADAGMLALFKEPVDVEEEIRAALVAAGARATLAAEANLPRVECDPARLRQIFGNVLTNALRYSPQSVPIAVTIARDAASVKVSIADAGPGFPPDQAEAIFERFHRVDDSRSRDTGGTGLGLAIARQLVESHGGRIGAYVNERGGATVWFTLPLTAR